LKAYIFYSGVFLIDAKETNKLYFDGIEYMKNIFILPIITKILASIWKLSRQLPIQSSNSEI
jgi:hypothetical protein